MSIRCALTTASACLALALAPGRLAAQAPVVVERAVVERPGPTAGAPTRCRHLIVVPGDTVGRPMRRATGDTLVDPRMPRGDGSLSCASTHIVSGTLVPGTVRIDTAGLVPWRVRPRPARP